jgi:hypothetical protein
VWKNAQSGIIEDYIIQCSDDINVYPFLMSDNNDLFKIVLTLYHLHGYTK